MGGTATEQSEGGSKERSFIMDKTINFLTNELHKLNDYKNEYIYKYLGTSDYNQDTLDYIDYKINFILYLLDIITI